MSLRIKLLAAQAPALEQVPMPLDESLKWDSPFEKQVESNLDIFFAQSAYLKCVKHASSDLQNEVGGVLVGRVRVDPGRSRQYLIIEDILPALYTDFGQTHVTFTQDTLVHLNNQLEDRFPGKRIVGWFHTHPRLGIFLSSYDTWLHRNFFPEPIHVALVLDPYNARAGFFVWQAGGQLDPSHYVGFFEGGDQSDETVVEMDNLTPVIDETETSDEQAVETEGGQS